MIKKVSLIIFSIIAHLHGDLVPMQISEFPRIFMFSSFLSDEECDHMIAISRQHLTLSKVVDEKNKGEMADSRRTSRGTFLYNNGGDRILNKIEKRIAAVTGEPVDHGESFQVLHYGVGGEYQPHYDYFNADTPGGAACLLRGGQRILTMIMYLNTPEEGGETIFPRANIFIIPRKGDAVLFYNCLPSGMVDPNSFHGGAPVIAGEKWIMTKWIREGVFH